ncbi:hypothetical protein RND81_12G117900 [Saponaria officinalis]|uniref:Uncharacterized protein n=1 Tax=Saponaria officinalis TaxID=3572 RepID=A0AAW1H9G4_SAPOF
MSKKNVPLTSPPSSSRKICHGNSSYHSSLDSHLYISGIGHVAPDTYSGYGSLLDSDDDAASEVTSSYYLQQNTVVGDSLAPDPVACDDKTGKVDGEGDPRVDETIPAVETSRSGEMSPSSKRFIAYAYKFFENRRKKANEGV